LRWSIKKQEFLVPVVLILKALKNASDREIYEQLVRGDHNNTFLSDRLEILLKESKATHL
jgi:DNA-directed RNA polymerase I subunit RPA2